MRGKNFRGKTKLSYSRQNLSSNIAESENMAKKGDKRKFLSKDLNDLINESQFLKNSPKRTKNMQKLQKGEDSAEDDESLSKIMVEYQTSKKKKLEAGEEHKQSRQKLLDVMDHQMGARKHVSESLLSSLSEVVAQQEADCATLDDNEKKLEHLAGVFIKCVQQTSAAAKSNLAALKEIRNGFKKEFEELETKHKQQSEKLADALEEDMEKLQKKLVSDVKRKQLDNLRKSIFNAMQNDF